MANKSLLDRIDVKTPCNESWDEMAGNNEVRFCSHCAKDVHDLSAMKRTDAEKLVQKSNSKLCVRYVKSPDVKLITTPPKFTQIKRRATIAASVLATSLTFTTLTYAQGQPIVRKDNSTQTNRDKYGNDGTKLENSSISGEVKDESGVLIPKARITLRNSKTNKIRETTSNDEGSYEFNKIDFSIYELTVVSPGFKRLIYQNIEIPSDIKIDIPIILVAAAATIGVVSIESEPIKTNETKPIETFPLKKVKELPRNRETSFMGDMNISIERQPDLFHVKIEPNKTTKKKKKN